MNSFLIKIVNGPNMNVLIINIGTRLRSLIRHRRTNGFDPESFISSIIKNSFTLELINHLMDFLILRTKKWAFYLVLLRNQTFIVHTERGLNLIIWSLFLVDVQGCVFVDLVISHLAVQSAIIHETYVFNIFVLIEF